MIDYKEDAEQWGNALNKTGWDCMDQWEKMFGAPMNARQFNNIKSFNRFVILNYMKNVENELDKTL